MKPQRALLPLVPLYAGALAARELAYGTGLLRPHRLAAPVVSVGNLSVGGAGKTPLVIHLAQLLSARGFAVDVLSRGYGRESTAVEQVAPHAPRAASHYGDEPTLIASAAGVPVYVGASRYQAGLLAERQRLLTRPRLHLLDDGFQHRQLARAADIVLLHRSDFAGGLLPAGRLREPLRSLRRASFAVLRVEDAALEPELRKRGLALPVWWVRREIELPAGANQGADQGEAFAFCGIAHAQDFFDSLRRAGVSLAGTQAFADHHVWSDGEVRELAQSARAHGAQVILTTEKDLIRLGALQLAALRDAATLMAVQLRAHLVDAEAAVSSLLTHLEARRTG